MRTSLRFLALPLLAVATIVAGEPAARLEIAADFASAEVPAQPAGRRLVQLPGLEFDVRITPNCPAGSEVDAVSVTIADSQHVFRGELFAGNSMLETRLAVPARQLAPLPLENACGEEQQGTSPTLSVPGVLTAHASLRCSSEDQHSVHYEALSLGVDVVCPSAAEEEAPEGDYSLVSPSACERNATVRDQASAAACAS